MITSDEKHNFFNRLSPIARDEQNRSGIDPLITITQAAHESGWGQSELTQKANNLFGFTGEAWETQGKPIIKMPTKEFVKGRWATVYRPFRAYLSWADSVRDWATLMQFPRYKLAFADAKLGDLAGFAKSVYSAGYATDPDYSAALIRVGSDVLELLSDDTNSMDTPPAVA